MPNDSKRLTPADLRHLEAYLSEERREEGIRGFVFSDSGKTLVSLLLSVIAIALGVLFFMRYMGCFVFFALFGAGQAAGHSLLSALERTLYKEARDPLREQAREAVEELRGLCQRGTLARRVHPAVGRALEDCAEAYHRLRRVLSSAEWKESKSERHWKDLERASMLAGDEAMVEAIHLALPGVRRHGQRKANFEAMVADDPDGEALVRPLREVEGRLRELVEGLEQASGGRALPAEGVERALEQLRTIQKAEAELDQLDHRA